MLLNYTCNESWLINSLLCKDCNVNYSPSLAVGIVPREISCGKEIYNKDIRSLIEMMRRAWDALVRGYYTILLITHFMSNFNHDFKNEIGSRDGAPVLVLLSPKKAFE